MQTRLGRRLLAPLLIVAMLAACSAREKNPYLNIEDAPLTRATLHTVTLVSAGPGAAEARRRDGYTLLSLPPNYPAAMRVEAARAGAERDALRQPQTRSTLPGFMMPFGSRAFLMARISSSSAAGA